MRSKLGTKSRLTAHLLALVLLILMLVYVTPNATQPEELRPRKPSVTAKVTPTPPSPVPVPTPAQPEEQPEPVQPAPLARPALPGAADTLDKPSAPAIATRIPRDQLRPPGAEGIAAASAPVPEPTVEAAVRPLTETLEKPGETVPVTEPLRPPEETAPEAPVQPEEPAQPEPAPEAVGAAPEPDVMPGRTPELPPEVPENVQPTDVPAEPAAEEEAVQASTELSGLEADDTVDVEMSVPAEPDSDGNDGVEPLPEPLAGEAPVPDAVLEDAVDTPALLDTVVEPVSLFPAAPQPDESGALVVAATETGASAPVAAATPLPNANLEVLGDGVYWIDPRRDLEKELAAIPEIGTLLLLTPIPGFQVSGFEHVKTETIPADAADLNEDSAEHFLHITADGKKPVVVAPLSGARGAAFFKGAYLLTNRNLSTEDVLREIQAELNEAGEARDEIVHRLLRLRD